jgi:hypothetical protein
MRGIAEMLIDSAVTDRSAGSGKLSFSIAELRPNLLTFMGQGGLRAVVARALFLVGRDFPTFRDVSANADGSYLGLDQACARLSDSEFREARISLLTEVFLLLLQFLGPSVTLAVISDAWPDAPLGGIDLSRTSGT